MVQQNNLLEFLIPQSTGGRLVMGNPLVGFSTDPEGNPVKNRTTGEPQTKYNFNVAVPKTDPSINDLIAKISQYAAQTTPQYFGPNGQPLRDFAFKIIDGDSSVMDMRGNKWCDKEGYRGCWVFKFQTTIKPPCYASGGASRLVDPTAIKTGDYIRVHGFIKPNNNTSKPGLYFNPDAIELIGYGDEIKNGPDAAAIFGGSPVASLPPGASTVPVASSVPPAFQAPQAAQMPPAFQAPQAAQMPPAFQAPQAAQMPQGVQPAHDFLAPQSPPVQEEKFIIPNYQGSFTRAQLKVWGYTDEAINQLQKG